MTIDHCRAEQLRCAAEILRDDQPDKRGAALGLFDWFTDEYLILQAEAASTTDR